jgi:hypothetical protein
MATNQKRDKKLALQLELGKHLVANGYTKYGEDVFAKTTPRREIKIDFLRDHITKYVREYPGKEGWSLDKYKYTKADVDYMKRNCNG